MKSSTVDTDHNPSVGQEHIGLLEGFDVFVSVDIQHLFDLHNYTAYFEFAMLGES